MTSKSHAAGSSSPVAPMASHRAHLGDNVRVGQYIILAAGTQYGLQATSLQRSDVIIPLTETVPAIAWPDSARLLHYPLPDFGGVPDNWGPFLREQVVPLLRSRKLVMAFCVGSHGRTGTFIASLIALLEPHTVDPIAAARQRHCLKAVETLAQARGIFALRDQEVPEHYLGTFHC